MAAKKASTVVPAALVTILIGLIPADAGGFLSDIINQAQKNQIGRVIDNMHEQRGRVVDQNDIRNKLNPQKFDSKNIDNQLKYWKNQTSEAQRVPIEAYPWVVAITNGPDADNSYFCAGVAISDEWLLTTAYCAAGFHIESGAVLSGSSAFETASRNAISQVVIHPEWNKQLHSADIALLRVATSESTKLTPIDLIEKEKVRDKVGDIGQVVGWGQTNLVNDQSSVGQLKMISTRLISAEVCSGPSYYTEVKFEGQFCAQSLDRQQDACVGFGGSPLILNNVAGQRFLAGLVGWGDSCPPASIKPTVYVDVSMYSDWIFTTIGGTK